MRKILFLLFLIPVIVSAQDHALLIGINNPLASLPIKKDIAWFRKSLLLMGFKEYQIETLNHNVTLAKLKQKLIELAQQSNENDRIVLYFSGHGARITDTNGDETEDHADEVLLMADTEISIKNGKQILSHVLIDDELDILLKQFKSKHLFVFMDACHSGTMNKNLGVDFVRYIFGYRDTQLSTSPSPENYIFLSASLADEFAVSTEQGSFFSRAIYTVLSQNKQPYFNLSQLATAISKEITRLVKEGNYLNHQPLLTGNLALATENLLKNNPKPRPDTQIELRF